MEITMIASRGNQVTSETVQGANLAVQHLSCDICVEECSACERDHTTEKLDIADNNSHAGSSFAHAVINMAGMLIGKVFHSSSCLLSWILLNYYDNNPPSRVSHT